MNVLYIKLSSAFIREDRTLVATQVYLKIRLLFWSNIKKRFLDLPRGPSSPNTASEPFGKEGVLILKVEGL